MERSDWSRAVSPPGAPCEIPYNRSNVQILGKHLIGREQFHRQEALRVNCVDGSDWSRAIT